MKRFLKNSLSLILTITIIFSSAVVGLSEVDFGGIFAIKAEAASSGTCGDNLTWVLDDNGTLTISGSGAMKNYSYYSSAPWYSSRSSVKSVVINSGVTSIGEDAFYNCISLTSITIGDSVTSIGDSAFYGCTSLTSVTIGDSVTSIGYYAFRGCTSLTSITIGDNVTSIGSYAFYNCISLTSITIGDSVTSIGDSAFYGCTSLTSVTIPDNVTSIRAYAFYECISLTSITIPDSVTSIGDSAFEGCTSLKSIAIPDSVTRIGSVAFYECISLTSVYITDIAAWCNINFSIGSSNPLCYAKNLYLNSELVTDLVIPDGVTSIGDSALYGCTSLTSITIPDSVTSIGDSAFYGCTSLTSITIPDSVTSIGDSAFYGCTSLTSVTIPDSVTSIRAYAFYECISLTSITIPDKVTSIGKYAFGYYLNYMNNWKIDGFTIYGGKGKASEVYANKNGFRFVNLHTTHIESDWITDKKASVNSAGSQHKECTECGEVLETAVIPQLKPATPKLSKAQNTANGVKVTWGAVDGADSYIVYRRAYNTKTKKWGGWTRIADDITATSYVDKNAKSDYYRYTVKAVNEGGTSGYDANGIKTYFLATPKVTSTANTNSAITVKWGKVTGATGYIVYRKTGNGKWQNLGKTTGTSFTDKTAKAGVTYRYTVRAYYGSYLSSFVANGYAVRRLTTPTLKSVTSSKSGVTFNWNKVAGATGYIVYRKTGNSKWQNLGKTTSASFTDKTAKKGVTYTYTVRAYYGTSTSYYNTKGLSIKDKY